MKEEQKQRRTRHFMVVVSGDANDGDYITKTEFVTDKAIPALRKWEEVMAEFDESPEGQDPEHYCNDFVEWCRDRAKQADPNDKWKPEDYEEVLDTMSDYTPSDPGWGEYPHSFDGICVYELVSDSPIDLSTYKLLD